MDKLQQEIAITGCGWVTPFAVGGISEVLLAGAKGKSANTGSVPEELLESCEFRSPEVLKDKSVLMAAVGIQHALSNAGLVKESDHPERIGFVIGCSQAGQLGMIRFADEVRAQSPRFVSPLHFPQTVGNYVAGALARTLLARGPNLTIACGVASGLASIWEAATLVAANKADIMFAGGVDGLLYDSDTVSRSNGQFPAEGACMFVVESVESANERGASILARISEFRAVDEPLEAFGQTSGLDCSVAGIQMDRAAHIESWVGDCGGALGAGAVAVLLGASEGYAVPRCDNAENTAFEAKSTDYSALPSPEREFSWIVASSSGSTPMALALKV